MNGFRRSLKKRANPRADAKHSHRGTEAEAEGKSAQRERRKRRVTGMPVVPLPAFFVLFVSCVLISCVSALSVPRVRYFKQLSIVRD